MSEEVVVLCDGADGDGTRCDRLLLVPRTSPEASHHCPEHQTGNGSNRSEVTG